MTVAELECAIGGIRWFHRIDVGPLTTPGIDNTREKLSRIHMPDRLDGLTVLDIGAWDGFFSFEAERRGASRVLATDSYSWGGSGWGTKAGFELARQALHSRVEDRTIDAMDLSPDTVGEFDVVLFLGVLYHLRHPLLALEHIARVTRKLLILETQVDLLWHHRPALAFYPGEEMNQDPSNWFGPNPSAIRAMLRTVGFQRVDIVYGGHSFPWRLRRALLVKLRQRQSFWARLQQDRMAFHAYR